MNERYIVKNCNSYYYIYDTVREIFLNNKGYSTIEKANDKIKGLKNG